MILKYYYNCKEFVPFHKGKTNISLHISKTIKIPKFIFVFAYKLPFHEIEFILHTLTCFLRNNLINVILNEVFVKTLAWQTQQYGSPKCEDVQSSPSTWKKWLVFYWSQHLWCQTITKNNWMKWVQTWSKVTLI